MDGWNAPMWVDFDASVMSDIDEYFNVEHEELESGQLSDAQYHSCPSTPKSKKNIAALPCKTPKSDSNGNSSELSDYIKALQINTEEKLLKGKLSMTPRNYVLKKACLRSTTSSTPRVTGNDSKRASDAKEKNKKLSQDNAAISKVLQVEKTAEEKIENSDTANDEDQDDDNADQNQTLVALVESEVKPTGQNESTVVREICTNPQSESPKESEHSLMTKENTVSVVAERIEDPATTNTAEDSTTKNEENRRGKNESTIASEISMKPQSKLLKESENSSIAKENEDSAMAKETEDSAITKKSEDPATEEKINDTGAPKEIKDHTASVVNKEKIDISSERNIKISVDSSTVKVSTEDSLPMTKSEIATNVNEGKTKISKSVNRVDPLKHGTSENKKRIRNKPTVLTSHARRQSTSKYRRVSGKYVSLAEAVSKFQHGTPERFRSSNNKDSKTLNAVGPLQKARHTTLKVTYAISPLLRCKYRTRAVSTATQEEREIMEIEEIRKNRLKPNPIKRSIMEPSKKLQSNVSSESVLKSKKTMTMNDASKKNDKKPMKMLEALPSKDKPLVDPVKPLKKFAESTTIKANDSSNCKQTMKPTKILDETKKPATALNIKPSLRRTMMNPPKVTKKVNEPATTSGMLLSSRRTMMNSPKPLTKIDNKSSTIAEAFSLAHKTLMKPSTNTIDVRPKPFVQPFPCSDKKKEASNLSSSIIPESATKHTPCKKTITTIISTEDGAVIKDVEILHFGIPVGNDYKRFTKTVPFSFETRAKELKEKKEKLKNRQIEEPKKPKTFHARPVPSYIKATTTVVNKPLSKPPVMPDAPFSFQRRNENLLTKKKEMFEKMLEREKQARIFHAKPAPNLKPVFVRGASAENLRDNNSCEKTGKFTKETRRRGLSQSSINDNRENIAPNTLITNQPSFPKLKIPLMTQSGKLKKTAT